MAAPELSFAVEGAAAERFAAAPLIHLDLRIGAPDPGPHIRNIMLQCQVRIEPVRRRYEAAEQTRLADLFGEPERWSRTLQSLLWTNASVVVPGFTSSIAVALPLPCSFDFNIAVTKYVEGLDAGEVPLVLLFSGSVFYDDGAGLQIGQIPWSEEVRYRLPVAVWQEMMAHYYPDSRWLHMSNRVFERLRAYRQQHGLPGWEQTFEKLLKEATAASEAA